MTSLPYRYRVPPDGDGASHGEGRSCLTGMCQARNNPRRRLSLDFS